MKDITFYPSENSSLGSKQIQVLCLTAQGLTKHQIAELIFRSVPTVAAHQVEARHHYGARSLVEAVAYAIATEEIRFVIGTVEANKLRKLITSAFMIAATVLTAAIDTPFVGDADQTLARHHSTRTMRMKSRIEKLESFV